VCQNRHILSTPRPWIGVPATPINTSLPRWVLPCGIWTLLLGRREEHSLGSPLQNWAGRVPPFKVTHNHCDVVRSGTYDFLLSIYSNSWAYLKPCVKTAPAICCAVDNRRRLSRKRFEIGAQVGCPVSEMTYRSVSSGTYVKP